MTPTTRRWAGVLAAVAAGVLTACSSTASSSPSSTQAPATTTTIKGASTPAQTQAAALRARVTALTTANVYLTSVATSAVVSGTDPAPAVAAVDKNSHALTDLFGSRYAKLYSLWAQQTPLYIAYVRATVANDSAAVKQAKSGLDAWRQQLETFLAQANPYVIISQSGAQVLDDDLSAGVQGLLAFIDAQAARSVTQYDKLVAAAVPTPHLATQLAAALAKQLPAQYPGTAVGGAANLRASLTATLVAHTYLLGITTATVIGGGNLAPTTAVVEGNGRELANAFGSVYGDAVGQRLYDLWTRYIGSFVDYARAAASSDPAARDRARAVVGTYPSMFAALAAQACPKLSEASVSRAFANHVSSQAALVDAQAAHQPAQFDLLRQAGGDMATTAELLSEGIAEQFPLKYLP